MRVLLINPPFSIPKHQVNSTNTGLAYLAAYLHREGHELSCLEMNQIREGDGLERLRKAVEALEPQVVGFSLMGPQSQGAIQLCRLLRRLYDGPVIFGGPHPTCMGEDLLEKHPEIDVVVLGEGEVTTAALLHALGNGVDFAQVAGIIYRHKGEVKRTKARPLIKDLDKLPWPLYDLFGYASMAQYPLLTSRGCPFSCIFCYKIFGKVVRFRKVADCVEELAWALEYYNTDRFRIIDDAFNVQTKRAEEFCDLLLDKKLPVKWAAPFIRADQVTPTLARKMKESGCFAASVGIESFDPEVFAGINKGEALEDLARGTTLLRQVGIIVGGSLIVGLPKDTFRKTLDSFHKAMTLVDRVDMTIATPIPGTKLYEWIQKESRLLIDLEEGMGKGFFQKVPFETPEYTAAERLRAFHITAILSNIPEMPTLGPKAVRYLLFGLHLAWRMLRWNVLILLYDGPNYFKHLGYVFRRVRAIRWSRRQIQFEQYTWSRTPDGTWNIIKDRPELAQSHNQHNKQEVAQPHS